MVVTLAYSVLQPVINGMACFIFFLLYQMYKYLFLYQLDQPAAGDTGGLFFPKAITHIFVGLYVEEICLCALFFLQQDSHGKPSCIGEGALMIVLIVITAGFHMIMNDSYGPLLHALPLSLVDRESQDDVNRSTDDLRNSIDESAPLREKAAKNGTNGHRRVEEHELEAYGSNRATNGSMGNGNGGINKPQDGATIVDGPDVEGSMLAVQDFTHPALRPARIVWLPEDILGLAKEEVREITARGIAVTTRGAVMNEKGTVDVDRYPPGEKPVDAPVESAQ